MVTAVASVGPLVLMLWAFCIGDVLVTPSADVRRWSKLPWLVVTVALPGVGSVAWIASGRPATPSRRTSGHRGPACGSAAYDIGELTAAMTPDEYDALRRECRGRAQEQRRRYAEQQAARRTDGADGALD
jgi:hypothetical protein